METFSSLDLQVFREKSRAFCGSFKVPLDKLRAEDVPENPRQTDQSNIARLVDVFEKEGCWPLDPENHVEVLVSQQALEEEAPSKIGDFPYFNPSSPLEYLSGHHRIEAARRFLTGRDRWWIADLYLDVDLSKQVRSVLRERDPKSKKYYDGDILRQIRISTLNGDVERRKRFFAKFQSKSKEDMVKRLEAQPPELLDSFDDLIPFTGLWAVNFVGTLGRMFNMHLPEVLTFDIRPSHIS